MYRSTYLASLLQDGLVLEGEAKESIDFVKRLHGALTQPLPTSQPRAANGPLLCPINLNTLSRIFLSSLLKKIVRNFCKPHYSNTSANPITVTPIWKWSFANGEHPIWGLYRTFFEKFVFKFPFSHKRFQMGQKMYFYQLYKL